MGWLRVRRETGVGVDVTVVHRTLDVSVGTRNLRRQLSKSLKPDLLLRLITRAASPLRSAPASAQISADAAEQSDHQISADGTN